MEEPIKIMHIDSDYRVVFILIRKGALIKSTVSLEAALTMLKSDQFDFIRTSKYGHTDFTTRHLEIKWNQLVATKNNNYFLE
jgi:hypothetical protein